MSLHSDAIGNDRQGRILSAAAVVWLVSSCAFFVLYRVPYLDEGWYVYAGLSVYEGKLPYRDFCYTQAPLLPYLYGLATLAPGWGLWGGRLLSMVLGVAACMVTIVAARRHFGDQAAAATALLLAASVHAHGFYGAALTYGPSVFWLALSFMAAFSEMKEPWRTLATVLFATIATGVRLSAAAVLPVLIVYLASRSENWRRHLAWASMCAGALLALTLGPFALGCADVAFYETLGYHVTGSQDIGRGERILITLAHTAVSYGIVLAAALAGAVFAVRLPGADPRRSKALSCAAAAAALFVTHLVPATTDPHYFAILVPVAALAGGYGLSTFIERALARSGIRNKLRATDLALCLLAGLHAAGQGWEVHRTRLITDRPAAVLLPPVALRGMGKAADCIARNTDASDPVLTFDPGLALHAQRGLLPGLEMGTFAFRPDWDKAACERHHAVNWPRLIGMLTVSRPKVVALSGEDLKWLRRSDRAAAFGQFVDELRQSYAPVAAFSNFGQFRETLVVFVRRKPGRR